MAVPQDADDVLAAVRLGWYVAEVHGRNRPDPPPESGDVMPSRAGHALPLRVERTGTERRIEAQTVVSALARRLSLDTMADGQSFSAAMEAAAKDHAAKDHAAKRRHNDAEADAAWARLAKQLYAFDAHIQDALTAVSDTQACGYQLGRGLAETYWALDPTVIDDATSDAAWDFLLGDSRCAELARLVGRLSAYFNMYTAPAVAGCLEVWKSVAAEPDWRADDRALADLHLQMRRWYELLILGQDPSTMIKPFALLKGYRVFGRAVRLFWPQLLGAAISLGALGFAILLIAHGSGSSIGRTLVGALGVVGLSVTSLYTKLKSSAQTLLQRIRDDAYTDLVAVAITVVPPPPGQSSRLPRTSSATERIVTKTVRQRSLTSRIGG